MTLLDAIRQDVSRCEGFQHCVGINIFWNLDERRPARIALLELLLGGVFRVRVVIGALLWCIGDGAVPRDVATLRCHVGVLVSVTCRLMWTCFRSQDNLD